MVKTRAKKINASTPGAARVNQPQRKAAKNPKFEHLHPPILSSLGIFFCLVEKNGEFMENRERVVADYLKLRVILNKPNLERNQKTEVNFYIEEGTQGRRLFAFLKGLKTPQRLELCFETKRRIWKSAGYSGLSDLEDFLVDFLNMNFRIKNERYKEEVAIVELKSILRSLGIPK